MGVALVTLVAFTLVGCDQFSLDEAEPTTSISLDETISSQAGFNGLLVSMYDRLQSPGLYGQQYMLYPDALADNVNLVPESSTNRYPGVVANRPFAHLGGYGGLYSTINEANNILADIGGLELDAENPQAIRDRIRGEALFLRGMAYFDLVRIHSYMPGREVNGFSLGVPLRTEPTRSAADAEPIPRDENTAIYDQVVSDLEEADSLLAGNPDVRPAPTRATGAATAGLLSRVHLYLENWSEAEAAADQALSRTGASVVDARSEDFEAAWEDAGTYPGSVFELSMTQGSDATTADNSLQTLTDGIGGGFFAYEVLPSEDVRSTYPSDDARRDLFATDPNGNVYLQKYTGRIAQFTDPIPLLRVAELYLNRAEARAQQGDDPDARSDLDYIRERRNIETVSGDLTGQALIDSILVERRREFLFEGKRFFTLKRYARDIPKPQQQSDIEYDGPLRTDARLILAPLPTGEVQSNPEIEQNPGY